MKPDSFRQRLVLKKMKVGEKRANTWSHLGVGRGLRYKRQEPATAGVRENVPVLGDKLDKCEE